MRYDKQFLLQLDKAKNKTIFARITALTFDELPIETIEGRVTQGSVNIDGASAVRRTCSLTIVAQNFNYNDYYWGLNTKFKLEVGVENTVDASYPDIIWFPQGIYLITSFNTSRSTNNFSITIQGKDKMCLLNGEVGGTLESSIDFGTIEEEDQDGIWRIRKIPIPEIIRNAVHVYGGEPYHNIIINDLDTYGLELLEYRHKEPMYLYRNVNSQYYTNATLEGTQECIVDGETLTLAQLNSNQLEMLVHTLVGHSGGADIKIGDNFYKVAKIEYGHTAGYRETELTYAGDLIANVGESLTSILDKIKNMLVEFEYFYDLNGRFVFQKKQSFLSTMWSPTREDAEANLSTSLEIASTHAYMFSGSELITAFNNNPNLLNLRNDFSIWGEKETVSGAMVPIHMRYALHKKPKQYTQIQVDENDPQVIAYNQKYGTKLPFQPVGQTFIAGNEYNYDAEKKQTECDWREVIYQMALDYYRYNILDDFEHRVAVANQDYYPIGRTGYERYYADIQGFWRLLYNPYIADECEKIENKINALKVQQEELLPLIYGQKQVNTGEYVGGLKNYYIRLQANINNDNQARKTINEFNAWCVANNYSEYQLINAEDKPLEPLDALALLKSFYDDKQSSLDTIETELEELQGELEDKQEEKKDYYSDGEYKHWNKSVYETPEALIFWFDFLDTDVDDDEKYGSELDKFKVEKVGARSKSINDQAVKSIYFRETPDVIFQTAEDKIYKKIIIASEEEFNSGVYYIYDAATNKYQQSEAYDPNTTYYIFAYPEGLPGFRYIQIPGYENMFSISGRGKSAKERLDELLYQHSYCIESATITAIPIYYLEPNIRVYLHDDDSGLDGDYIVSKISLPLAYNGTMQLTATKAAENII